MSTANQSYQKKYRQEHRRKHKRISLTVNFAEYSAFQFRASQENCKVTSLVRKFAFDGLTQQLSIPQGIENELQELRFLIRNIANNVNQAAHHSNIIHQLVDEQALLQHIKSLEDTIQNFTEERLKPASGDQS